jgi:predicted ferric reductase
MTRGLPASLLATLYAAAALAPLVAAAAFGPEPVDAWAELASGTGLTASAMLLLQFVSSGRFEIVAGRVGLDVAMGFHRLAALALTAMAVIHPVAFALAGAADPAEALARLARMLAAPSLLSGILALAALVALLGLVLGRTWIGLPYTSWRIGHGLLAVLTGGLVADHVLRHGGYLLSHPAITATGVVLIALALGSVLKIWGLRWIRARRQDWRVEAVRPLAPGLWEVTLHQWRGRRFHFEAGQFAWVVLGRRHPLTDNPFSIASAPEEWPRLRLVIREAGDMTSRIGNLVPGTAAALDGPHGALTLAGHEADAVLLVAGGVGAAPIIGILRSLAARQDRRPVRVLVATRSAAEQVFREEIAGFAKRLDLQAEHLVVAPTPGSGPGPDFGPPLSALLRGLDPHRTLALLCGPLGMMEAVAGELEAGRIPPGNIRYERFDYGAPGDRQGRRMRRAFLLVLGAVALGVLAFALRGTWALSA